jgi:mRNA interferase MazF
LNYLNARHRGRKSRPTVGSEIKKTRSCLVVAPDEMNRNIRTVIIAPITSVSKDYPTRISFVFGKNQGEIVLDQIRRIDKIRRLKKLGTIGFVYIKTLQFQVL